MTQPALKMEAPGVIASPWRADFPVFDRRVNGKEIAFLDSAASAQKPRAVIDAMSEAAAHHYANIHRGVYGLSQEATTGFEAAREKVARFVNAASENEIVFTRNATEAINLIAASWGRQNLGAGDEIILTELEHHANIVPWQMLRDEIGIVLRIVPVQDDGSLKLDDFRAAFNANTRLLSVQAMSNALGTIHPVAELVRLAKERGVAVLVDACQSVTHMPTDVQALGADWLVFSGHKLYGPSGIGVLWGRYDLLAAMAPYQGGGDMIETVTFEHTTFREPPARFEAGTPAIVEAVGLGAAVDYLTDVGFDAVAAHEAALLDYATARLADVSGLRMIGTAPQKGAIISFTMDNAHPHDIGTILDKKGVAVRTGHHCCMPLMARYGLPGTARASMAIYNTSEDVDRLVDGLHLVNDLFG